MKKFDYIRTMMTMTLTPICLGVFIMLIYFVNNYGEYFPSKEEGGRMTRSLSRAELTALYEVPEDMESAFTRQELRDLRKTFGAPAFALFFRVLFFVPLPKPQTFVPHAPPYLLTHLFMCSESCFSLLACRGHRQGRRRRVGQGGAL